MSEPTNTTIAEDLRETYNLLKAPESEQRFIQAKLWMELAERTSAAEAERDKYKENLHDAEGRYLACYNELVKVQAERDALKEKLVVTDEDVEAYRGSSTSFDTVANSPLLAKAIQRVFDRRNALNAPKTAKDLLRENFKRVHYSLSDSELDQLIAIAEAYAQEVSK